MFAIDLFSGTGIVTNILRLNGFTTCSIDISPKYSPTLCMNVLRLNYEIFSVPVNFIWASVPCTHFSRQCNPKHWIKTALKYRNYHYEPNTEEATQSMRLLYKTISIIQHLNPDLYIIENPVGRMRHIEEVRTFVPYRYSVNYKDWGFNYSKETDLFTNQLFCFDSKKISYPGRGINDLYGSLNRSKVPPALVQFIIEHAHF